MIRKLVQVDPSDLVDGNASPVSILGSPSIAVTAFDDSLRDLIEDLIDTLFAHPVAIGLAAPQIGDPRSVAVVNVARADRADTLVMVNPSLQSASGKRDKKRESCMSLPGYAGTVERRTKAHVSYQGANGKKNSQGFEGFLARVVQHEVDHLNGTLYSLHTLTSGAALEPTDIFDYPDPGGSSMS